MTVTVRPIEPADRGEWRELFQAYATFYQTHFSDQVLDGVWQWLMDDAHPETGFVAHNGNRVVGFAHLQRQVDTFRAGPGWFLDDLFVAPSERGKGIGRQLIDAVSAYARGHGGGDLRWITAEDNVDAQGLYDTLATRTTWVMFEKDTGDS